VLSCKSPDFDHMVCMTADEFGVIGAWISACKAAVEKAPQ
jgi:hypothetical protein